MTNKPMLYETYAILDPDPKVDGDVAVVIDPLSHDLYDSRDDATATIRFDVYDHLRDHYSLFEARKMMKRVRICVRVVGNG